jgi:hypothetical protein
LTSAWPVRHAAEYALLEPAELAAVLPVVEGRLKDRFNHEFAVKV